MRGILHAFTWPLHILCVCVKIVSTVDLMLLPWNFSIGCFHLDLCGAYIKLRGYIKGTLKENEVKQQVSTRVCPSLSSRQQSCSFSTSPPQHCVFLPANIYQSCPALLHVPASTVAIVDLTGPCCHTLQGQIVPLAHCELYTSLLQCFIDLKCFSVFQIERLSVPALCSLHVWSFVLCGDQPWKEDLWP